MPITKALSIQQPWAWMICAGLKDIENRNWPPHHRGPVLVHAGKKVQELAWENLRVKGHPVPELEDLPIGGIVGRVDITGHVLQSDSEWFFGPHGFVLANAAHLPLLELPGALGFFNIDVPEDYLREAGMEIPG